MGKNESYYFLFVAFLLLLIGILLNGANANAALIRGTIYDLSLEKESNVIVQINTTPKQTFVSKGGDYQFYVDNGNYELFARTEISEANESITIANNGNYTLDIILDGSADYEPINYSFEEYNLSKDMSQDTIDSNQNISQEYLKKYLLYYILTVFLLLILVYFGYTLSVKSKNGATHSVIHGASKEHPDRELDEYESKILSIIKKEKHVTQKDLRREIPLSEAKISLILSALEHDGRIKKIKKGRGNIILFLK